MNLARQSNEFIAHAGPLPLKPAHAPRAPVLRLACGLALCAGLGPALPAWAQVAPGPGDPLAQEQVFSIPPGPLGGALARLAAQAGLLFVAEASLVDGRPSGGLQGRHTVAQAFALLLQGSGLELVRQGAVHGLRPVAQAPADGLPVQTVQTVLPLLSTRAEALPADAARYRATRAQQPAHGDVALRDLPQSVSVLPGDFARDIAPASLADLLRYVPGLNAAQGEGNRDTPVFRGNQSTADFLLDGLRDDVPYYRDLYNIDRVEALRGPNAMAVGHGAVGGLINRVSKEPGWTERRELSLQTGSWQQARATLDWDQRLGREAALRLNLLYEDSESYRHPFHLRRFGVNPVLAWRPSAQALWTVGFEHYQDHRTADRGIPAYQGRPLDTDPGQFFGNPDASTTWIRLNALNVQLDLDLGDGLALRHRSRLADYDKFFQNVFPGNVRANASANAGALEVALLAHNSLVRRQNLFSQTELSQATLLAGLRHQWLAGLELGRQQGDNGRQTGYFGAGADSAGTPMIYVPVSESLTHVPVQFRRSATDPDNSSELHVAAFFLQDQVQLSPQWQATLGLRHDRLSLAVQDRQAGLDLGSRNRLWSPRAGLVYRPADALSLYANTSVGRALRAGEQLSLLTPANQGLAPEQFINHELGLKWTPRPGLDLAAALYQLDRRNVAVPDPAAPTLRQILVDGQRTRGLELSLVGQWRPGWQVVAGYTWQDSRVRTTLSGNARAGATMPHVPRHGASVWNRFQLSEDWALGLGAQARGAVFTSTDNTVQLPGYLRLDGALYYTPRPGWRLQLNLDNLLDRRYAAFAHSNNNITPGTPRALRLGLSSQF